jgi:hypothetical protein
MKSIHTSIFIGASPDKVWQALTESPDWRSWNPFVVRVEGRIAAGEKLANTLELPGQKPMTLKPKVLKADPGKELRWQGRLLIPGLFDGEHYFIMEPEANGTRFTHGEIFKGIFIGMLDFEKTEKAFVALNEGLKRKVEGRS